MLCCMIELKWQWDQETKWMQSENEKTRKTIRCDDLMLNELVDAIIYHNYITNITHIHDLWYNCIK